MLSPFADELAGRIARLELGPILEIMADVGTLSQAIAASVSDAAPLVCTGPDDLLLAHAAEKPGTARVSWRQARPDALPFDDAGFHVVACLFGIATLPDRVTPLREVRRVLKPGGRFLFTLPQGLAQNPVAACVQTALATLFPDAPPRHLVSLHGYGEPEVIDDDLSAAGFTEATFAFVERPFSARSAEDVRTGLLPRHCAASGTRGTRHAGHCGQRSKPWRRPEPQFGDGPITATLRANVVSAGG